MTAWNMQLLDDTAPQVEDVSGVVAFLCGPEAKFINGAIIPIDGGYSCNWSLNRMNAELMHMSWNRLYQFCVYWSIYSREFFQTLDQNQ